MAAVSAEFRFATKLGESVANVLGGVNNFDYSLSEKSVELSNSSTPDIEQVYAASLSLVAGALTIDLTSLARAGRTALDLTGLTVYAVRVENLSANDITLVAGASNPYGLFPATNGVVVGSGGGVVQHWRPGGYGVVGASNSDIDVSGTGTDSFLFAIVAGTA